MGVRAKSLAVMLVCAALAEPAPAADSKAGQPPSAGAVLAPKGTRARLDYTVSIDGAAERKEDIGAFDKWSTHRTLAASMELVAGRPTRESPIDVLVAAQAAAQPPSADMRALEQDAKACAGDVACMGRVAQKMASMSEVQSAIAQLEAAEQLPIRYQSWELPRRDKPDVKATIETHTDKLFLTSVKERTTCSQNVQLGADKVFVQASVFVDAQQGIGYLGKVLNPGLPVIVAQHCEVDMGGRKSTRNDPQAEPFLPTIADPTRYFPGNPVTNGDAIAQGQFEVDGSYGDILGVPKTARVVVQWKLTRI